MSSKLDQSLDEILQSGVKSRGNARRAKGGRRGPVGGVQKKQAAHPAQAKPRQSARAVVARDDSKIVVTNMPPDVTPTMVEDYLFKSLGATVKDVLLAYNNKGQSTGSCTITFRTSKSAYEAAKELDGLQIDRQALVAEVCVKTRDAPAPHPVKPLSQRVGNALSNDKPAAGRGNRASARGARAPRGGRRGRRGGNVSRPKKTADQLDAEMTDYFGDVSQPAEANAGQEGGAQAPAVHDAAMGGDDMM